jgi:hypothetical protein
MLAATSGCGSRVELDGDAGLCAATIAALGPDAPLGPAECPTIIVRVARGDERIIVEIIDASGRASRREVTSIATIVALIESWTLVPAELLEPPAVPKVEPKIAPKPTPVVIPVEPATIAPIPADQPTLWLDGGAVIVRGDNGATLAGPELGICVRFGMWCADLSAHFLYGEREEAPYVRSTTDLELLVGTSAEIDLDWVMLGAGLHAGPSVVTTSIGCQDEMPNNSASAANCRDLALSGPVRQSALRPRALASVRVIVPLGASVAIALSGGAAISPSAEGDRAAPILATNGARVMPPPIDDDRVSARLGLSLQVGL